MPRRVVLTPAQHEWLRHNVGRLGRQALADRLGIHRETLIGILYRDGLVTEPARHHGAQFEEKRWTRPCMSCGDTAERPRGQYQCERCKAYYARNWQWL